MAKQPNIFKSALTRMSQGYGVVPMGGRYGTSDPRGSASVSTGKDPISTKMDSDYSATGPSFLPSAGNMSSEGRSDFSHQFAGSGLVTAIEADPEAPGYTSRINEIGNFWIRDPAGNIVYSHGEWVNDNAYRAYKNTKEAAKEEEVVEPTSVEEKTDEIQEVADVVTKKKRQTKSAGPAQDAAEEFKEKGRKSTIMTSAQGITDEPVTGMLSEGEAEAERKRRLRKRRSLLAG